ncbi:MAG TPA: radical SAM protein [Propionibacteriaceae bacterium]|nr:radical SAM protein [Propionibacteriaceae bacterium]
MGNGDPTELLALYSRPLEGLLDEAWALRQANFPPELKLAAPSTKRFEVDTYRNLPHRFVAISLTGGSCQLQCEHCQGRLLESMYPARSPSELCGLADALIEQGCQGVLLSGGANKEGQVPLAGFEKAIGHLKERGLKVIVHTGLLDLETALSLKAAGVDQVLLDVIGDRDTIRQVYHLDKSPADYEAALAYLKEAKLAVAPHVVIGLHFGRIRGELEALRHITAAQVEAIILVVLNPLPGTPMDHCATPTAEEAGRLAAVARILNPHTRLALGCARPPSPFRARMEQLAIRAGVNVLAYPSQQALDYASSLGLTTVFSELCCSLL